MVEQAGIILIIGIVILSIIIVLTLIYISSIIFVRRFHTVTNILTGNVCFSAILSSFFWIINHLLLAFYPIVFIQSTLFCFLLPYFDTMFNCLIIYALAMITINRFFTVSYPQKRFFKRQTWSFISTVVQWLIAIVLPLPNLAFLSKACLNYSVAPFWLRFYNLSVTVILPSIVNGLFNSLIFLSVRLSTRRVHALGITTSMTTNANRPHTRDIYLLKHMLFIFVVSVGGWTPVHILLVLVQDGTTLYTPYLILQLLPGFSSLIVILDLFWYNHALRNYLKERFLNCLGLELRMM